LQGAEEAAGAADKASDPAWAPLVQLILCEMDAALETKRTSLQQLLLPPPAGAAAALARLAENLVLVCAHQLEAAGAAPPLHTTAAWILLHRVIEFQESRKAGQVRSLKFLSNTRRKRGSA